MAFRLKTFWLLFICAIALMGVTFSAFSKPSTVSVHIGVFNSKKAAQNFFKTLPDDLKSAISYDQLWLDVFKNYRGFIEHHINIANVERESANTLCKAIASEDVQCISSVTQRLFKAPVRITQNNVSQDSPLMLRPLGLRIARNPDRNLSKLDWAYQNTGGYNVKTFRESVKAYGDNFTLESKTLDTPEAKAALAAYRTTRDQFLSTLQNVGKGINHGEDRDAALAKLITLGERAFEAAGSVYLSGFLEKEFGTADALASDAGAGATFIHHVKENLSTSAQSTIKQIVRDALAGNSDMAAATDALMVSGARGVIDAGLAAARRSDLYALRHLELEYNINNFEDSYASAIITQPVYQSEGMRHNIFLQGGGILNEQSVDVDDDVARHTLNVGAAYRYLTADEKYLLGGNIFYDHQWPYNHSRLGLGVDAKSKELNFAANYYHPLSGYKDSRRDTEGNEYEERALKGFDAELGYSPPFVKGIGVFAKGYQYYRETDDDIRGVELSAEYNVLNNFTVKGALVEENGGRDGVELALQYRIPLYDTDNSNLALADMEPAAGSSSVKSRIFEKVRRSNTIRVEERLKAQAPTILTAQFNALSTGLPYDVGGNPTGAGVNLPFNTIITVPNGRFGIINFSNGAVANVSASGGGDVTLQFNETTLTVIATNGGFVQFISGSGGISVVNVPGGTVNLLGTDIDVTDDGATTTIQVRAGEINVVPDIGVDVEDGDQGDVVNLVQATGVTTKLAGAALETRQEAAFTNLDLINPDPPVGTDAAPFINKTPELTTGPSIIGDNADIRLTFTQAVTVTGSPQITGFVDANTRNFIYNAAASTPTELVFRHTFIAADVGAAGVTADELDLNGGAITGTSNNLTAITAFTSTVIAINDMTAPMLTGSTPVDNEPAFNGGGSITLNFDENVQANVGNIILTDTTDGSDTRIIPITDAGQVTIAGSTITINPTGALDLSNDYDLTIAPNVIQDTDGNPFAGITSPNLNFTTSNDVTPPNFTGSTPADNATGFAVGSDLVLNFNENIQAIAGNIVITDTTDGSDNRTIPIGDPQISIVGSTITIDPTTDLQIGTAYDVTMAAGVIEDLNGNDFGGITAGSFNFSTTPITSLAQVTGLATGNYIFTANAQTFTGYVYTDLGSSWLLVGKGREGWEFDANGQGTNAGVAANLGVATGFSPNAYEDAIVNDLITNAAIDLTGVEILIRRAANTTGTQFQNVLWRPTTQVNWVWSFDTTDYQVIHDVQASILGAASSSTRNTRDAQPGNDYRRIFTWAWGGHNNQKGFAYGNSVDGVNGNDPNTFMWEFNTERHATPYAEIYIRVE